MQPLCLKGCSETGKALEKGHQGGGTGKLLDTEGTDLKDFSAERRLPNPAQSPKKLAPF